MKLKKRILSLALAAVMVLTTMVVSVSAQTADESPLGSSNIASENAEENTIIKSVVLNHDDVKQPSVFVNATFDVTVKTTTDADQIYIFNEGDRYIAHCEKGDYVEENGIRTFEFPISLGTPGTGKLYIHAYANGKSLENYRKALTVLPEEPSGKIKSVEFLKDGQVADSFVTNEPFDVRVVTSKEITDIALLSEEGEYNGSIAYSRTDNGDTYTFMYRSAVPTPGNRRFTISGKNANGDSIDYYRHEVYIAIAQDYDLDVQFSKDGQPISSVYTDELFDVTVTSPIELGYVFVNNERMLTIAQHNLTHEVINGQHVYKFQISLGSAGSNRALNVYGGIYDETETISGMRTIGGKVMNIDVVAAPENPDDYQVTFSIDGKEVTSAKVNQTFDATFVTPENIGRVGIKNERGNWITTYDMKTWVENGKRIFTCNLSVGSAGQRTFTIMAEVNGANWVEVMDVPFTITK